MFDKLIKKIKTMAKNRNAPEKEIEKEVPSNEVEQTETEESAKTKSSEVSDELTQDVLEKAISIAKNANKNWDDITQEERWKCIKQARN